MTITPAMNVEDSNGSTDSEFNCPSVPARSVRARAGDTVERAVAGRDPAGGRRAHTQSSGRSRKARTPTTFRRWPRSIRTCSASPWSPPTARSTPPVTSRPRSRSSRSPKSSRWPRSSRSRGRTSIEKRIGVDATGARFNSIIAVEAVKTVSGTGAPEMNPLVNPGAISATSMVTGATSDAVWAEDHRHPQRRRGTPADRAAGRLQVRVRHQPAQPGHRRTHARLRLHQDQLAAGGRSLHAPVLDRRERDRISPRWRRRSHRPARIP